MIRRISLATDFSAEGQEAFRLALAMAVARRARLDILHVSRPGSAPGWDHFPRVREVLEDWTLLPRGSRREDVMERLGVEVVKVEIHGADAAAGIADFLHRHRPDLLVAASHGRGGLSGWLSGSVALAAVQRSALPALLTGPACAAAVDPASGTPRLARALFPVAEQPAPRAAVRAFGSLFGTPPAAATFLHVLETPDRAAAIRSLVPGVELVPGDVVPAILAAAERLRAELIVMPTEGSHGFMDALRGSTTQQVLRQAACPVFAIPSGDDNRD